MTETRTTTTAVTPYQFTLDQAIAEWLYHVRNTGSNSEKTIEAYRDTMHSFRSALSAVTLDLLGDPRDIARIAPLWASTRHPGAKRRGTVANATYNQRLACISSFYSFLQEVYKLDIPNPMKDVPRRRITAYEKAQALAGEDILTRLASIDTQTIQGKRDFALLALGVMTGRRANELLALQWKDISRSGADYIVTFEHCKGGKVMRDLLDEDLRIALFDYLQDAYGDLAELPPDAPIFISFSRRNPRAALSTHTFNDICAKVLGTTKIHALRHTFAKEMESAGATLSEIQERLGHENIATTARYLKALGSAKNKYASHLARRFGLAKAERNEP